MDKNWHTHNVSLAGDELDHLHREWLLTNGTGAYAMGTLPAINARRYHGLFVPTTHPPVGRIVAVNQIFENLMLTSQVGTRSVVFSSCNFQQEDGSFIPNPEGHTMLRRFDRGLTVSWVYMFDHIQLIRELELHQNVQAATLRYTVAGLAPDESAKLNLHPMMTMRDFHALCEKVDAFDVQGHADSAIVSRDGNSIQFSCDGSTFTTKCEWWYGIGYPMDAERGQGCREDYFLPGHFTVNVEAGKVNTFELKMSLGMFPELNADRGKHLKPMSKKLKETVGKDAPLLAMAADDFVVDRTVGDRTLKTILAGYPWFADWGRDTFIALPGLLLCTGRYDAARDTLAAFASVIKDGLVPNRFDDYSSDESSAHYNSVDAALWFIQAAHAYMDATEDNDSWNDWLCDAVKRIIEGYIKGAGSDVRMAGDGMIYAGNERTQLTWMDAKCNDVIFTPRQGKAVEINALWYCGLAQTAERLKNTDKQAANHYTKLTQRIKRAYVKTFWDEDRDALRDHVWLTDAGNEEHADRAVRPNQIFAVSLPYSPLPQVRQKKVLAEVRDKLLTRYGLRTLPETDPHYHPQYTGEQFHRDKAYHQGTIWPWLMGPYAEGVLRVGKFSDEAKAEAMQAISPLLNFLKEKGIGQLHEIHEAQPPHRPVGCMAQAWSVAELVRVMTMIGQK
jgi:predicted glycogen debranching enzyme